LPALNGDDLEFAAEPFDNSHIRKPLRDRLRGDKPEKFGPGWFPPTLSGRRAAPGAAQPAEVVGGVE
jgi:hypothetical protein